MADAGTVRTLKEKRRKYVRRLGKPVLRAIDDYVGRHSLVPNAPVLDSTLFPWETGAIAVGGGIGGASRRGLRLIAGKDRQRNVLG